MQELKNLKNDIIKDKRTYYFDFTASALALKSVEKKMFKIMQTYANTHSHSSLHSFQTQEHYEKARQNIKKSLKLSKEFALINCGTGSTAAIKKFQELLGIYAPPKLKEKYFSKLDIKTLPLVIVGPYEHHSNELSFKQGLCECVRVPLNSSGEIDFFEFERILKANKNRQIIASFSLASNVTGILSDYKKIYTLVKAYKGILAFDVSSFIAYKNVPCKYYDALFISSHKLLGGIGAAGLLVIKKSLCDSKVPSFAGGGVVRYVSRTSVHFVDDIEHLEEAGTPGILQLIKASYAFALRDEIGLKKIEAKMNFLKKLFFKELKKRKNIEIYAKNLQKRLGIFSFNVKGISPFDLALYLSKNYHIETRAGCACAGPYGHDLLGLKDDEALHLKPGFLRVSLHYIHDETDLNYFFKALDKSIDALLKK